eukprot:UN09806
MLQLSLVGVISGFIDFRHISSQLWTSYPLRVLRSPCYASSPSPADVSKFGYLAWP